jgi:hypothetical protein
LLLSARQIVASLLALIVFPMDAAIISSTP